MYNNVVVHTLFPTLVAYEGPAEIISYPIVFRYTVSSWEPGESNPTKSHNQGLNMALYLQLRHRAIGDPLISYYYRRSRSNVSTFEVSLEP